MSSSPLTISIAPISRLTANILELLIDSPSSSRLNDGMDTISQTLDALRELAKQVERDWIACPLASFTDRDIGTYNPSFKAAAPVHHILFQPKTQRKSQSRYGRCSKHCYSPISCSRKRSSRCLSIFVPARHK